MLLACLFWFPPEHHQQGPCMHKKNWFLSCSISRLLLGRPLHRAIASTTSAGLGDPGDVPWKNNRSHSQPLYSKWVGFPSGPIYSCSSWILLVLLPLLLGGGNGGVNKMYCLSPLRCPCVLVCSFPTNQQTISSHRIQDFDRYSALPLGEESPDPWSKTRQDQFVLSRVVVGHLHGFSIPMVIVCSKQLFSCFQKQFNRDPSPSQTTRTFKLRNSQSPGRYIRLWNQYKFGALLSFFSTFLKPEFPCKFMWRNQFNYNHWIGARFECAHSINHHSFSKSRTFWIGFKLNSKNPRNKGTRIFPHSSILGLLPFRSWFIVLALSHSHATSGGRTRRQLN